jgi:uncharacterized Zn finger protein (UPF0148 family)
MERCVVCGNPTFLFYKGRPICVDCDQKREGTGDTAPVKKEPQPETRHEPKAQAKANG